MAGGALGAAFKSLAEDADQAAGQLVDSLAEVGEKAADTEEANLARTLETEAKTAQGFARIGASSEDAGAQAAADAGSGAAGGLPGEGGGGGPGGLADAQPGPVTTSGVGGCGKAGEPVDVVTGQYVIAAEDVTLPGILPLTLRRAYASGYRGGRLFGPGWASTLDQRIEIDEEGIRFAGDDAQVLTYPVPTQPGARVMPVEGARWPLTWDRRSDEIAVEDVERGWTWHFTTLGAVRSRGGEVRPLTAVSDRGGNRVTFVRDDDGVPVEVQHSGGYRVAVDTVYTAAGVRVEGLRLIDGGQGQGDVVMAYQYDPRGRLVGPVDSTGLPLVYEYDRDDRITAWTDRVGYRFAYEYDEAGRVVRTSGDGGYLSGEFAYEPENLVTAYTNGLGQRTEYHYDLQGRVARVVDPLGNATVTERDRHGRILGFTDQLGHVTRYTLSEQGDPTRVERPDGTVVQVEYDARRSPTRVVGPDGQAWRYTYDERGNLLAVADPVGAVTAYAYGEHGELNQITDALGRLTRIEANRAGLTVAIAEASGARWAVERDARGRIVSITDPSGAVTATAWNGQDRPVSRTHPDGSVEAWTWDANGSLTGRTDPAGNSTGFEVGPFRLVTARTDPDGARYAFEHDSELRLLSVTNPQQFVWQYSYDAAGRLTGERDFNGRALSYARDPAGRVTRRTNGVGESVELVRDRMGRVVEQRVSAGDGSNGGGGAVTGFEYDASGRLVRSRNADCELVLTRDPLGRIVAEAVGGRVLASTFDALGRRLVRTTPTGYVSTWQYDAAGRPLQLESGARRIFFGRDAAGRESHRWIGADTALTSEWDQLGRLTARRLIGVEGADDARTSRVLQERGWTYRADGAPDAEADSVAGNRRFDVDPLGRITAVHAATWTETYAYDTAGNLTHADDSRAPEAASAGERTVSGTLLRKAGRTRYEYDGQGRLVSTVRRTLSGGQKNWTFAYDAHDRLVEAVTPAGDTWRYRYDPLGRRISKQRLDEHGAPVEETRFAWDGAVLAEQDHFRAGAPVASATSWDVLPGTWSPVAQDRRTFYANTPQDVVDEQFHAIVTDLAGTPTDLVTPEGTVAWRRRAGLWGKGRGEDGGEGQGGAGTVDCPLRFPGQYHDDETGLDYNYHRYYDPDAGRFTAPDPIGLAAAPNQHAYVDNPLVWIDPRGLAPTPPSTGGPPAPTPAGGYTTPGNGAVLPVPDVLDAGTAWLGPGYTEPIAGSGRYVSQDGTRVFRIGDSDILGLHGGGPHANFEALGPNPARPGRMQVVQNDHVYFDGCP